jgi:hypothetical protein
MSDAKVTAFRFSDEELELLGVIQGHTGVRSRMEALREVLRYYAESEGLTVPNAAAADAATDAAVPEPQKAK